MRPLSEATQLATVVTKAFTHKSADDIPADTKATIVAGVDALEKVARRAKDLLGRTLTRAYGVDVTERGVVILADGPQGKDDDGTPLSEPVAVLKKELKRIARLEAQLATAEKDRDEARRNLSSFVASVGVAAGGDGTSAPERVIEKIVDVVASEKRYRLEADALAPLVDKSVIEVAEGFAKNAAADSKRIDSLLARNSELHNEKVALKNDIASLKRTLAAVEDQRNVAAAVLENLAENPEHGVQPLALNALAEMRLIPAVIVTANGMTDERIEQLRLQFEKMNEGTPPSTASSTSRSLPRVAINDDRVFEKFVGWDKASLSSTWAPIEWADFVVGDLVRVVSDVFAPGIWRIDDIAHLESGSVLATAVNITGDSSDLDAVYVSPVAEPVPLGHVSEMTRVGNNLEIVGALSDEGVALLEKAGVLKPKASSQALDLLGKTVAFLEGIPSDDRKRLTQQALDLGAVLVTEPGTVDFLVVGDNAVIDRKLWSGAVIFFTDFDTLVKSAIQ